MESTSTIWSAVLGGGGVLQIALLCTVFCIRVPVLGAAAREQRRAAHRSGTNAAASLLNASASPSASIRPLEGLAAHVLLVLGALALCGRCVALSLLRHPSVSTPPEQHLLDLLHYLLLPAGGAMWLLVALLGLYERHAARRLPGRSLRLWLVYALLLEAGRTAHLVAPPATLVTVADYIEALGSAPALLLALVALLSPDTPSDVPAGERPYTETADEGADGAPEVNREATSSFASRLTYSWLSPLLARGARRPLEHTDLYLLQTRDSAEYNHERLARAWSRRRATPGVQATMLRAWHDAFGVQFWTLGLMQLGTVILSYISPIFVNLVTSYVSGDGHSLTRFDAYSVCAGLVVVSVLSSLVENQYSFWAMRMSQNVQAAVGQSVYEKALTLDYEQRERFGIGKIVSYMQVDSAKLAGATTYLHLVWSAPLQLGVASLMLYNYMGWAGLTSVAICAITALPVFFAGKANTKFVLQVLERRDKRVKFASEVLSSMRMLKLFAWEGALIKRLDEKRKHELAAIFKSLLVGSLFSFIFNITPMLMTAMTFAVYVWAGNTLTPAVAFTAITLFTLVRVPFIILPLVINGVVDVIVVNKRLSRYFNAQERPVQPLPAEGGASGETAPLPFEGHFISLTAPAAGSDTPAVEMRAATFKWPGVKKEKEDDDSWQVRMYRQAMAMRRGRTSKPLAADDAAANASADEVVSEEPTLSGLELRIPQGTLVGVAGPVGCGKSSLLMAVLGDIPKVAGRVVVRGRVALCLQEPWIQTATLKDNVLFGAPFDAPRYERVLEVCALQADIAMLPGGDATEIGERGVNLSGGQKARIALARACYADASLYLLDDILAAVDQHTGRHLMYQAIMGLLKERGATVVLCTHHTQWLSSCDHVLLIEKGQITQQGPPGNITLPASEYGGAPAAAAVEDAPATTAATAAPAAPAAAAPAPAPAAADDEDDEFAGDSSGGGKDGKIIEDEDRSKGYVSLSVWCVHRIPALAPCLIRLLCHLPCLCAHLKARLRIPPSQAGVLSHLWLVAACDGQCHDDD